MSKPTSASTQVKKLKIEIERLKKMNQAKTMVLSILTHNAIPSLHYMKNITRFTIDNWETMEEKQLEDCAKTLNQSSDSLHRLSESILEWTRHQVGFKIRPRKDIYFHEVVSEELKFFKSLVEEKELVVVNEVKLSHFIKAEAAIVRLIVQNLFSNSIKFSLRGGKIRFYSQKKNSIVHFYVEDEGIGISEEQLDNINRLMKVKAQKGTNNELGFGLGLLIIDDFIAQLNGRMSITSTIGKGTIIKLSFPEY